MGGVLKLLPNNALCVDRTQLAERARALADRIEAGEFGDVERLIILIDNGDGVPYRVYGRQCNNAELVGLLEYAKARVMDPPPED